MSGKKQVCREQKENLCINAVGIVGTERHISRKRCERQETDFSRGKEKLCINVVEIREQEKRICRKTCICSTPLSRKENSMFHSIG